MLRKMPRKPLPARTIHTNGRYLGLDTKIISTAIPRMMTAVLRLFVPTSADDRQHQKNDHRAQISTLFFLKTADNGSQQQNDGRFCKLRWLK